MIMMIESCSGVSSMYQRIVVRVKLPERDLSDNVFFSQIPSTTPFGSQFSFHPSSGRLEVDAQETIEIDFCPNILGEFHETFHWELSSNNKSACTIPISFKGIE